MGERGPEARQRLDLCEQSPRRAGARRGRAAAGRRAGTRLPARGTSRASRARGAGCFASTAWSASRKARTPSGSSAAQRLAADQRVGDEPGLARDVLEPRYLARAGAARAPAGARPPSRSPPPPAGGGARADPLSSTIRTLKSQPSSTSTTGASTRQRYSGARVVLLLRKLLIGVALAAIGVSAAASAATGRSGRQSVTTLPPDARRDLHARGGLHLARPDRPRRR